MLKNQDRWQAFDLVEAFHLSQAVNALHDLGLLAALTKPCDTAKLAARYKVDETLLRGVMDYVAARTNLLKKTKDDRFVLTRNYDVAARFFLDLYVGAYGGNAVTLQKLLLNPARAASTVDRLRHARAFAHADQTTLGALPGIVRQLGFTNLLDLGCGNGDLLLQLGREDRGFIGVGVDVNPAMLKLARSRARAARLGRRVQFIEGDYRHLRSAIPVAIRSQIGSVTACNSVNELFGQGVARVVQWLKELRRSFPTRPLLILDYYGRLGEKKKKKVEKERETLLHDFAQLISGQGVPPGNFNQWNLIYREAGCQLVHVIEDKRTTRFIHLLRL
jgi:SAM-dependent methyltransferase